MELRNRTRFFALWTLAGLGTLCVLWTGCASLYQSERIPGVPRPAEQMRQIRELGANATRVPQEKRQQYAQTLATVYREQTDAQIRREAVLAIAHYQLPLSETVLREASGDADRDVREATCMAWKTYGGDVAVTELIRILGTESDTDIRLEAIETLGELGDERAIAAFEVPLTEQNPAMQHYTVLALQKITGKSTTSPVEWLAFCREHSGNTHVAQDH